MRSAEESRPFRRKPMLKKATTLLTTLALGLALTVTSFDSAEARRGRNAAIAGGVALGVLALGAAAANSRSYDRAGGCYKGPRECRWVGADCYRNRWGERVCEGGYRECHRPTYCD
jgi:hypothetical protein